MAQPRTTAELQVLEARFPRPYSREALQQLDDATLAHIAEYCRITIAERMLVNQEQETRQQARLDANPQDEDYG